MKTSIFLPLISFMIFNHISYGNIDPYPKNPKVDVINYIFDIKLSDKTDEIICNVSVDIRFLTKGIKKIRLDLVKTSKKLENKGMTVIDIKSNDDSLEFLHDENELWIYLDKPSIENERKNITIKYRGIPCRYDLHHHHEKFLLNNSMSPVTQVDL